MAQQAQEADRAYASGDIRRAADLYASIVERVPEDADAWFRLGNARFRLQQPDEAVVAYQRAIGIRPDHARALYNLGVVRLKQAQAAMIASAQAGKPGDALRRDGSLIAQRLAKVGEDISPAADCDCDGGAPPFIVEPRDTP
jgi:tetratricopeptide (TPR) repeat protein